MTKRRLTTLLLALAVSGLSWADTIVLNDGTQLEGKVLSEDAESYLVAVQITATIKDERRIQKADIKSIDRSSADDIAFEKIAKLVPTPDRLTARDYNSMINKQVLAFMEAFPATTHKKQVETILTTLEKERELATAGGLKLDGRWISAEDRQANAFELDARIALEDIIEAARVDRHQAALRKFEEFEADFTASDSYAKALETAAEVMKRYEPLVKSSISRVDTLIPKRESEFTLLTAGQRAAAEKEVARRDAEYAKLIEREKKSRTKWMTLENYHKGPMQEVLRNLTNERKRIGAVDAATIKKAGASFREAYAVAAAGDAEAAKSLFNGLKSLKVPDRYIEGLEEILAAKVAESAEPDVPETPVVPVDPADTPEPGDDSTGEGDRETPAPADKNSAEKETPSSTDEAPPAPRPEVEVEGGSPMKTILFGVMALVLIVALVAVFAGGKKK